MKFRSTALVAASILALGATAQAADTKFGIQATLSLPQSDQGDLVDNNMGFGIGANVLIPVSGGHAIVPRLDYTAYSGSKDDFFGEKADTKLKILAVGADYNYYFSGKTAEGGYIGAGIGMVSAKVEATSQLDRRFTADGKKTTSYLAVCGGYAFTPSAALELRFQTASIGEMDYTGHSPLGSATFKDDQSRSGQSINLTFIYRF
jgi:hypothetical protein